MPVCYGALVAKETHGGFLWRGSAAARIILGWRRGASLVGCVPSGRAVCVHLGPARTKSTWSFTAYAHLWFQFVNLTHLCFLIRHLLLLLLRIFLSSYSKPQSRLLLSFRPAMTLEVTKHSVAGHNISLFFLFFFFLFVVSFRLDFLF